MAIGDKVKGAHFDLTSIGLLKRMLKSRLFQPPLLLFSLFVFVVLIWAGFVGTPVGGQNATIMIIWIFWFALLAILLIPIGGRIWCMICPLPAPGEWLSRLTIVRKSKGAHTLGRKWPAWLNNIWIQNLGFVAVAGFSPIILTRPAATSIMLIIFIVLVIVLVLTFRSGARGYAPCRVACPAGVHSDDYVNLISHGRFKEALEVHRETMPFAGVCGRVCTHPCETACERAKVDEPLSIQHLKRFMADYELTVGREKATPIEKTKEDKVAIVGSGPAGLACAYDLVRQGYPVTVFEAAPQAGGLLRYGIPEHRLPKKILDNEISYIEEVGVEIKTDSPVKNFADIFSQGYKAIFLGAGAGRSQEMGIPNEDAEGVIYALDFLKQVGSGAKDGLGERVAVIGGGNAAVDAARTALRIGAVDAARMAQRIGAKEVTIIYRRSRDEMPAITTEVEEAEREGIKIHCLAAPVEILTKDDHVIGIRCIRMELGEPDASGRRQPIPITGSEFDIAVDNVIMAIGQAVDKASLPKALEYTDWGTLSVDPVTLQTSIEGVFASGDVVAGADNVIYAIAGGKEAAISIDRYLSGVDLKEGRPTSLNRIEEISIEDVGVRARAAMPVLEPEKRVALTEVELGFDEKMAVEEAKRCLNCGLCTDSGEQEIRQGRGGRIFCRYVCPIGGFIALYSLLGSLEMKSKDKEQCHRCREKYCAVGSEDAWGCPFFEYPGGMDRNIYCGVCTECLKACPHDNISLRTRLFGQDLLKHRKMDEAFKSFIMLGAGLLFATIFFGWWGNLKDIADPVEATMLGPFNWSEWIIYFLMVLGGILVAIPAIHLLFSWLSKIAARAKEVSLKKLFVDYAYALVPLGLMVWIGFGVGMIMLNGSRVIPAISDPLGWGWDLFGTADYTWRPWAPHAVPFIQWGFMLLGLAGSTYVGWKLSKQNFGTLGKALRAMAPMIVFFVGLTVAFMYVFAII